MHEKSIMRSLLLFLVLSVCDQYLSTDLVVNIHSDGSVSKISERFIGVTIDTSELPFWHDSFFRSKRMITLARALSPLYIRMGGTSADYTVFSTEGDYYTEGKTALKFKAADHRNQEYFQRRYRNDWMTREFELKNFTLTAPLWDKINEFIKETGWDFIFDLNSLLRFGNGSWDMNNAVKLIQYSQSKGYKLAGWELGNVLENGPFVLEKSFNFVNLNLSNPVITTILIVVWELGNKPNVYKGHDVVFPLQLSKDFVKLRNILQQLVPNSLLIGPSVTMLVGKTVQYFVDFLKGPGSTAINASTFHHYYGYEGGFKLLDFLNPNILDNLIPEINIAKKYTKEYCPAGTQVWIGETSSVWGGGKPGYSDRYVAGFMWLDKLGLSAKLGIETVIRQDFYGSHYGLLNSDGFPNPDYWLTILYKLLVGSKVLNKTIIKMKTKSTPENLRLYSHCTDIKRSNYSQGSITVYGMNLNPVDAAIYFDQYVGTGLHLYLLEPSDNYGLTSGNVSLNGRHLELTKDGNIPNLLTPKVVNNPVIIPGFRFGFIVIPSANKDICN